jgi:hypothetical protein
MIAENVNTHAHGDVHLVVLAHLRRRWSLSGRDGFRTLSPSYRACEVGFSKFLKVFFTILVHRTLASGAPDTGPSVRSVVQRGTWPVLVTGASAAKMRVCTGRMTSASGVSDVGSCWVPVCTGRWGASDRTPPDASDVQNSSLEPLCSASDARASASGAALCCVWCLVLHVSYLLTGRWLGVRCLAPACPVRCVLALCDSSDRYDRTNEI